MKVNLMNQHKPLKKHLLTCAMALAVGMGLSGCNKEEATTPANNAGVEAAAKTDQQIEKAEQAAQAAEVQLMALPVEELSKRARTAFNEQRLYAPAGDNAMEYYLALRKKSAQPDASNEAALVDLMPYAVIAAEQAIGRTDFVEAERLRALIERADPQAPSLSRIAEAIEAGKTNAVQRVADEAKRLEDEKKKAELAQLKAEQDAAAKAAAAAARPTAPAAAAAVPERPAPAASAAVERPAVPTPAPTPVVERPAPTPAARTALVAISTPEPAYPPEALRAGISGEVEVEFSVARDGTVSNVRIVKANPRGTFDRGVQATVRKWRYQPMDEERNVRRTFSFR
jgi:periplasmic protein TonB